MAAISTAAARGAIAVPRETRADIRAAASRRRRHWLRYGSMLGGALVLIVGGGYYWLSGGKYVSTTDAYVQADVLNVSTDVSGIVDQIPVKPAEHVKQGQVLFRLDPLKFQIALDGARANLQQTVLNLQSLQADYVRAQRQVTAQEDQVRADQATFARYARTREEQRDHGTGVRQRQVQAGRRSGPARILAGTGEGGARPVGRTGGNPGGPNAGL